MKRMMAIVFVLVMFVSFQISFAQSLNTQGVLRDGTGHSVADGTYQITFRIWNAVTGGTERFAQISDVVVTNGVYNVTLGGVDNPLDMLNSSESYWLGVEVESDGEMTPRHKLNVSPYEFAKLTGDQNVFPGAGNVGIGTLSPGYKLDVNGAIRTSGGHFIYNNSDAVLNWGSGNNGNLYFRTLQNQGNPSVYTDRVIFTGSGRVGIGTKNPVTTLDIRSTTPIITVGTTEGTGGALYLGNSSHGVKRNYSDGNDVGLYTTNADVYLSGAGASTNYFVLKNNGNVGIGTASPSTKLHVAGQIYALSGIKVPSECNVIVNSNNNRAIMQTGYTSALGDFTAVNSGYDWDSGHEPVSMIASYYGFFVTKANTAGTPFGETLFKVDRGGSASISGGHLIFNSTHGVINVGNGGNLYFRTNTTTGNPGVYDDEAWIEADGEIKASGFISIGYDKSSKSSAKSYENSLNRMLQLNPVSFQKSDGGQLGFYVDELKNVIPEVVNEDDGIMGIDYGAMSVVAISAIQEQQKIIENQQSEIKNQQNQINDLESRLEKLETLLKKN